MKIEIIKVGELPTFLESTVYKSFHEVPITRLRGLSQAQNPRAAQTDIALIFAHEDNKLLSYIGLLPDYIWHENIYQKIWWNSCWWANEAEKSNVNMQLFYLACKASEGRLFFPELTPHTCELLNRMRNFKTMNHEGFRGYLKLNIAEILSTKSQFFAKMGKGLNFIDHVINLLHFPKRWIWEKTLQKKKLNYKIISSVDVETASFINEHNTNNLFRRNKAELNWITNNAWITEENVQADQKYAFSLQAKSFKEISVKIYEGEKITGFFVLLVRNGNAKLTYCYFNENSISNFMDVVYKTLLENDIYTFLTFNPRITQYAQMNKNPFIFIRKQTKTVAFPKDDILYPHTIQDGDGDCAFV